MNNSFNIHDWCPNNHPFPGFHSQWFATWKMQEGKNSLLKWQEKNIIHLENATSLRLPWKPVFIHPITGRSHIHFWIILSSKTAGSCLVNRKFHSLESFSWRKTCMLFPVSLLMTKNLNKLLRITSMEPDVPQKQVPGQEEVPSWVSAYWWAPWQGETRLL